jgi:hypothetical protein
MLEGRRTFMCRKLICLVSLVCVTIVVLTRAAYAVEPAPVGWWTLDDNAEDSSGNNNHGTLSGDPQWVVGKIGGALEFDGVDDHVDCGNDSSLDITGPITIAAWIYPTGSGSSNYPRIVDKSDGTGGADPGYKLYLRAAENYLVTLSAGGVFLNSSSSVELNAWNYVAFITDGSQRKLFLNGSWEEWEESALPLSSSNSLFIGNSPAGARHFEGTIDDVRVYNIALTPEEIQQAMKGAPPADQATKPIPDNRATDVPIDVTLSWKPGEFTPAVDGHILYLSENFDDVNNGIDGIIQSASNYSLPQRLDFETTYFWRVDEVNGPPDYTIHKGNVWSFTTEPISYPLENITATASSSTPGKEPENTVNGSGLDEIGMLHDDDGDNMWISDRDAAQPTWIEFEFDRICKLHEMWVWNYNESIEEVIGLGFKNVTIEYSVDGTEYVMLGSTHQFAQGPSESGYAHNTVIDLSGVIAKYIRFSANNNWGGILSQYGLSEVRFFHIPMRARKPNPVSGAIDVSIDPIDNPVGVTLGFRAGREAAMHNAYFSSDEQSVIEGTADVTIVTEASLGPLSLDLDKTYYWRIDEVNETEIPATWPGPIWNFSTQRYLVVDDFESYNDFNPDEPESKRIYNTWIDGYDIDTNGSIVGHDNAPFAEQTIVHSDQQSMPFFYSNTTDATYSEAELTLSPPQDWTTGSGKTLSMWFFGDPNNTAAQMYAKVNNSKVEYDGDADNLTVAGWQSWNIDLASFDTNLQNVTKLTVGIDDNGAVGKLFFDDIRLYPHERQLITPTEPNPDGLVAHYKLDQDATDSSGKNNHGMLFGNPPWAVGKIGSAVEFDGRHDYIDCGNDPSLDITDQITIAAWIYPTGSGVSTYPRIVDKSDGTGGADPGYKIYLRAAENYVVTLSAGGIYMNSSSSVVLNAWNYVAFSITGTQWRLFLNGAWEQWDESTLPSSSSNPLFIGNSPAGDRHFIGIIDDVRIYNRVLTPAEIVWLSGRTKPFDKPFRQN